MKFFAVPMVVILLLAGCAGTSEPTGTPGHSGSSTDTPVLQVTRQGGFAPAATAFTQIPELTVYGDGRAIVVGPQIAIYPAPALPNLLVHELSDEQLAALIELADTAGLVAEPPEYGQPPIADAMTTVVTLAVNGTRFVHEAYALGFAIGLPGMEQEQSLQGITEQQQQARDALSQFVGAATQLVRDGAAGHGYVPEAFAIRASPVASGSADAGELGVEPTVLPWPIDIPLGTVGDCLVVDDSAAEALYHVLQDANGLTRFEHDGTVYEFASRPLLPGEDGCMKRG